MFVSSPLCHTHTDFLTVRGEAFFPQVLLQVVRMRLTEGGCAGRVSQADEHREIFDLGREATF